MTKRSLGQYVVGRTLTACTSPLEKGGVHILRMFTRCAGMLSPAKAGEHSSRG